MVRIISDWPLVYKPNLVGNVDEWVKLCLDVRREIYVILVYSLGSNTS